MGSIAVLQAHANCCHAALEMGTLEWHFELVCQWIEVYALRILKIIMGYLFLHNKKKYDFDKLPFKSQSLNTFLIYFLRILFKSTAFSLLPLFQIF